MLRNYEIFTLTRVIFLTTIEMFTGKRLAHGFAHAALEDER